MRKELVISSVAQETRVAVVEDGELVEFLIERGRARGIAGNIFKGRVTKVLPGMQSAFVDIGLDRDAFLYVSDFLEDTDEYERMVSSAEDEAFGTDDQAGGSGRRRMRGGRGKDRGRERARDSKDSADDEDVAEAGDETEESAADESGTEDRGPDREPSETPDTPAAEPRRRSVIQSDDESEDDRDERADARRRRSRGRRPERERPAEAFPRTPGRAGGGLQVLPGESLAKYRGAPSPAASAQPAADDDGADEPADAARGASASASPASDDDSAEDVVVAVSTTTDEAPASPDSEPDVAASDHPAVPDAGSEGDSGTGETPDSGGTASALGDTGADEAGGEAEASAGTDGPSDFADDGPGDTTADSEAAAEEDETPRPARIIDRGRSGELSRRSPARRGGRRRSPDKADTDKASGSRVPMISDLLKEGQEILVQVAKEPLGKKGARITSHIALPGRYLVYMPTVDHVGVSRKISSEEERARLRRIIAENREDLPGGFIVRTAAEGRDEQEFIQDLRFLFDTWKEIRERNEKAKAPAVIHADLGLVERVLRDQLTDEFKAIRLDNEVEYTKVLEFVSKFQPSLVNRVKLHLKDTPIFEEYGLQQEIDKALRSKVWLKSGGYIVVNQTEALVAIDVNTGKFVGKSNRLEDTIVRTNIDAVHEIVRQIRLRNLGGIIVVDFIDMEERKNRQRVMQALEEELEKDRSPSKILQFNDFGLVAITRKRTQASLERVLGAPCPRCSGSGYVKSVETVCYEIQQELRKMVAAAEGNELTVRVSPEVAKALKSAEFFDLADLEEESRIEIRVQSDPAIAERFDIYE